MALNDRHAAWHNEPSFAVTLIPEAGEPTELAAGLGEFLEAVDVASEWLAREDPDRAGTTGVAIFQTRDGARQKVWEYPPQEADEENALVKVFGFDPVNWRPAGREFVLQRSTPSPPPPPAPRRVEPAPTQITVAGTAAAVRATASHVGGTLSAGRQVAMFVHASWGDRASRVCLIVAALSLWLAVTLVDLRFLALLLLASAGLWWRRDGRAAAAESAREDDDLL